MLLARKPTLRRKVNSVSHENKKFPHGEKRRTLKQGAHTAGEHPTITTS